MATTALRRPIGHDDQLSLVDHLDELRSRLIVSVIAVAVAFSFAFWQNGALLHIVNHPLEVQTEKNIRQGKGPLGEVSLAQRAVKNVAKADRNAFGVLLQPNSGLSASARAQLAQQVGQLDRAVAKLPKDVPGNKPVTLGVGEAFGTTLTVSLWFALLIAMPFLLWQLYAFLLPAFSPRERRMAVPLLLMIPALFIAGVLFGYFLVLPAAVRFLQTFNSDQFNVMVQARDYYKFSALTLLAMGIVFQVPVGILALTRFGIVSVRKLRKNRRYALVVCAVVATPLPGVDPVSMIIETLMLYVLYEIGILASWFVCRRRAEDDDVEELASF